MCSELDCRFSCLGLSQDHCTIGQETLLSKCLSQPIRGGGAYLGNNAL